MFLEVLKSKLTQHDKRVSEAEAKKGRSNIYRLGLLLEAAHKVDGDVHSVMDQDTPEALEVLKKSLDRRFEATFPPVKATLKQIDEFLKSGKKPSLIKSAAARWTPKAKVWYQLPDRDGSDFYFYATEIQKNGGAKGVMVEWRLGSRGKRPQPRAKSYSTGQLFEGDNRVYKEIPVSDVPEEVVSEAKSSGKMG